MSIRQIFSAKQLEEKSYPLTLPAQAPNRPPIYALMPSQKCIFRAKQIKIHGAGDIGCYTLGAVAPLSVVDTTVCMGASIYPPSMEWKGKGKDYIKNWVAVIGDSHFYIRELIL